MAKVYAGHAESGCEECSVFAFQGPFEQSLDVGRYRGFMFPHAGGSGSIQSKKKSPARSRGFPAAINGCGAQLPKVMWQGSRRQSIQAALPTGRAGGRKLIDSIGGPRFSWGETNRAIRVGAMVGVTGFANAPRRAVGGKKSKLIIVMHETRVRKVKPTPDKKCRRPRMVFCGGGERRVAPSSPTTGAANHIGEEESAGKGGRSSRRLTQKFFFSRRTGTANRTLRSMLIEDIQSG